MRSKDWMRMAAVLGVALILGAASLVWTAEESPAVRAEAGQTEVPAAGGHSGHHRPPIKGSDRYQYSYPGEKRLAVREVFDPVPPAPAPAGQKVHEYTLVLEENREHEVAAGIKIPAWTFNGTVPGPVLRAREGDLVRVKLVNKGSLPHTIHFHGVHPAEMDGVFEMVPPEGEYTYEFVARPYGVFPYHCHANPSSQHIHNGLYGMMIVDPKEGRAPMRELAMLMSAFDLDRDGEADFYAWNGKAFQYADHPVDLEKGEKVRMYVLNIFEEMMAPHIHGNMFGLIRSGTAKQPHELTDVVSLGIAERAILEFQYDFPGAYMFQCHFSEHMELGLMGWFRVGEKELRAGESGEAAPAAAVERSRARGGYAAAKGSR